MKAWITIHVSCTSKLFYHILCSIQDINVVSTHQGNVSNYDIIMRMVQKYMEPVQVHVAFHNTFVIID